MQRRGVQSLLINAELRISDESAGCGLGRLKYVVHDTCHSDMCAVPPAPTLTPSQPGLQLQYRLMHHALHGHDAWIARSWRTRICSRVMGKLQWVAWICSRVMGNYPPRGILSDLYPIQRVWVWVWMWVMDSQRHVYSASSSKLWPFFYELITPEVHKLFL